MSFDTFTNTTPSTVYGSHGTAVAGIVGASTGNSLGVAGVAPNVNLLSVSVKFGQTQTTQHLANGINWAWQSGADVINNSWGGGAPSNIISEAISNALNNGRNGLGSIVVFSAGNGNTNVSFPANSNPNILAVGAMSPCGERKNPSSCDGENWWGSNFGNKLDIVAPGVLISTTDRTGNLGYSSGNYVSNFNGTSAAAPFISGIASLMLSVNPNLTRVEVNNIIKSTAVKIGPYTYQGNGSNGPWNNQMGYGLASAYLAVLFADNLNDCESDIVIYGPEVLPYGQQATYSTNYGSAAYVEWSAIGLDIISTDGNNATVLSTGFETGYLTATIYCKETTKQITIYQQEQVVPYPNSADNFFNLDFTSYPPNTIYSIYIYDQNQNTIYSGESTNVIKIISTIDFPTGTYFLHLYIDGEITAKQLYVQH